MKNPTIIDKFIKKLNNNEEINFNDEDFQLFLNSYDVDKHNISTNTKVYLLLSHKLNDLLNIVYNKYIKNVISAEYNEYYNPSPKELFDDAQEYINEKYNFLLDNNKQFNLIKQIKTKYNKPLQEKIIINECKAILT
jgi:hypothetical protein